LLWLGAEMMAPTLATNDLLDVDQAPSLTPSRTLEAMSRNDFYFGLFVVWVCLVVAIMLALLVVS
jgi:hypothetical protein